MRTERKQSAEPEVEDAATEDLCPATLPPDFRDAANARVLR